MAIGIVVIIALGVGTHIFEITMKSLFNLQQNVLWNNNFAKVAVCLLLIQIKAQIRMEV